MTSARFFAKGVDHCRAWEVPDAHRRFLHRHVDGREVAASLTTDLVRIAQSKFSGGEINGRNHGGCNVEVER